MFETHYLKLGTVRNEATKKLKQKHAPSRHMKKYYKQCAKREEHKHICPYVYFFNELRMAPLNHEDTYSSIKLGTVRNEATKKLKHKHASTRDMKTYT
jgi:hypothetical protein